MAVITLIALILFALAAPAMPALAQPAQDPAAGQATQVTQGQAAPSPAVGQKVESIGDKLSALAPSVVYLMLIIAGFVLIFSAKAGSRLLVLVIAGALLLFGGWKLILDLVKYLLQ